MGDLDAGGARAVGDAGERRELPVPQDALPHPSAGRAHPAEQRGVGVGHRPAEHAPQVLVGVEVLAVVGSGEREGVDRFPSAERAPDHHGGRQGGAERFQDPALTLGEEQRT
ncbi:hypothetical protein ACW7N6_01255 [Streptomyces sp. UC1A3]